MTPFWTNGALLSVVGVGVGWGSPSSMSFVRILASKKSEGNCRITKDAHVWQDG